MNGNRDGVYLDYIKHEKDRIRFGWLLLLLLVILDTCARFYIGGLPLSIERLLIQGILILLIIALNCLKNSDVIMVSESYSFLLALIKFGEVMITVGVISILYSSIVFYFVVLLPITFITLTRGFRDTIPYIIASWIAQITFQYASLIYMGNEVVNTSLFTDYPISYIIIITVHYSLFTIYYYSGGKIFREYASSEEENAMLIESLGDKFVQLECAKKEIQSHYDKLMVTNSMLEETNKKLTSNLAEFYTLQQISQAITSIFDMNELLKFVNDIIIGVMGAYHSTIALYNGSENRLQVQVSSIFDKKALAIVSDFINCETIKKAIRKGNSTLDNDVNPNDYPFTQGRNIQSMICVPLMAKGKVLGIVLIEHSIKDAFDNNSMRLLEIIVQQVSIAIENARLYKQMHDLAIHDALTGAYNRIYLNRKLEEESNNAKENGLDLSFIIMDIDHFKKFNDSYGHLFGDFVLKTVSSYIMKTLRKSDIFVRYGGEEFVILMPHTSLEQATEKAENLRKGISNITITDRVVSASITVSIGVASYPETSKTMQELIVLADRALYEAKNAGRNVVRSAKVRKHF